jgi:hypothetical protein
VIVLPSRSGARRLPHLKIPFPPMVQPTDSLFLNSSIPPPPLRHSFNVPFSLASRTPPFSHVSRNCYGSPIARCLFSVGDPFRIRWHPAPAVGLARGALSSRSTFTFVYFHLTLSFPFHHNKPSPQRQPLLYSFTPRLCANIRTLIHARLLHRHI